MKPQDLDELRQGSVLQEHRFGSQTPLIGPFIARFRSAWHSVAGKWAIRSVVQQQSAFNSKLVAQLEQVEQQLAMDLSDTNEGLSLHDHDLMELTRTVAELTQQVIQLQQTVAELETRRAAPRSEADD
jgi:septal ring factor EnvC (AmiA/AmiB activator)